MEEEVPELAVLNELPNEIVLQIVTCAGTPCQIDEHVTHTAAFELVIAMMDFGVRFFEKHDPGFI